VQVLRCAMSGVSFQQIAESESEQFERRWQERQTTDHPVPVRLVQDPHLSFVAFTQDISSMGIALVSKRSFEVGTRFGVQIQDGLFMALTVRVVHVQPIGDGRFLLGCSLSRALTSREVDILLGSRRKRLSEPA